MTAPRAKPDTGTAHTPGPWTAKWSKYREGVVIVQAGMPSNRVLAQFDGDGDGPDEQSLADARLIAAAPDMFEALRDVVTFAALYKGKMEDTLGDEALAALGETALAALTRAESRP